MERSDSRMLKEEEYLEKICGKEYKVHLQKSYISDNFCPSFICGILMNFYPSGNIVIYSEEKGIFVFPYRDIDYMYPINRKID